MRSLFARLSALVFIALVSCDLSTLARAAQNANVVLVTLDTVRADHLSTYGYQEETSPQLSRIARSSITYLNAVAAGDMTLTSHGAIFTGLYGSWNGAHIITTHAFVRGQLETTARPIASSIRSLPEILRDHGYATWGVVANNGFLLPEFGFARGFEHFDASDHSPDPTFDSANGDGHPARGSDCTVEPHARTRDAGEITRAAIRTLKKRPPNKPFFLFVNYFDAHDPYVSPPPFNTRFPGYDCSLTTSVFPRLYAEQADRINTVPPKTLRHFVSQYDGAIAYLDSQIGELIRTLEETKVYENTLLVIVGDHGESLGEHGLVGHGLSVYQDQVHVPLIIKYPGPSTSQTISKQLASHVDLLPTITDVLGIKLNGSLQGRSLRLNRHPEVLAESFPNPLISGSPSVDRVERALYSGQFKLVVSTSGKRELYDLARTPSETENVCPLRPALCARLEKRLRALTASARR